MIPRHEILEFARVAGLQVHVIEKDYVLGWLLAGIGQSTRLLDAWVFKGGTCLKKCHFETYRFSEDLDFTLRDKAQLEPGFLMSAFSEVVEWVYENSGIEILTDRMRFDRYLNPRGATSCQGRVYYKGPATYHGRQSMPRIKLDLSADEILVEEAVRTEVHHPYSDRPEPGIHVMAYSYAEIFAEKVRALAERTRPRDLYDVIHFFRRPESRGVGGRVKSILAKKCEFKGISFPEIADLEKHKEACAVGWKEQLSHQLQALPPFESCWGELSPFFSWLEKPETFSFAVREAIPSPQGVWKEYGRMAGRESLARGFESFRFAAFNRLCVEIVYTMENGVSSKSVVEPYSVRVIDGVNLVLHAVETITGAVVWFPANRVTGIEVTLRTFEPRFEIDPVRWE